MNSLREDISGVLIQLVTSDKKDPIGILESSDKILTLFTQRIEEVEKEIKNWLYQYENYQTMMASRKSFQRGTMARDMSKEILSLLQELRK